MSPPDRKPVASTSQQQQLPWSIAAASAHSPYRVDGPSPLTASKQAPTHQQVHIEGQDVPSSSNAIEPNGSGCYFGCGTKHTRVAWGAAGALICLGCISIILGVIQVSMIEKCRHPL